MDDQGWRLEIKNFRNSRKLEAGANRLWSAVFASPDAIPVYDGIEHGGFYTQEEVREIVALAADLGIEVLPEIEMPGHSRAALAAYPELSCRGEQLDVPGICGVHKEVYCAGNDQAIALLEGVLGEVLSLFPSRYIHVGGDECPKDRWRECPKCQQRIKENGMKNEEELQSWFIRHFTAFLKARGRNLIGWDEILEGGLAPGAAVMSWRNENGAIHAAQAGHNAVMALVAYTYSDQNETDGAEEPVSIAGILSWQRVYRYEPSRSEPRIGAIHPGHSSPALDGTRPQPERGRVSPFPRLAALAEVAWTHPENRCEASFKQRIVPRMAHLMNQGVTVYPIY